MRYESTMGKAQPVTFEKAFMESQPSDGGLYVPEKIPKLTSDDLEQVRKLAVKDKYPDIAALAANKFIDGEIPFDKLSKIMKDSFKHKIPLIEIEEGRHLLMHSEGPTLSYKDQALVPVGRMYDYFLGKAGESKGFLGWTTGDTGPAGGSTLSGRKNVQMFISYPSWTPYYQKKQMDTLPGIVCIQWDAPFAHIQVMNQRALADPEIIDALNKPTTINSTNWIRIVNEMAYYLYSWGKISGDPAQGITFSDPSGNYSNLTANIYSKLMGLPMGKMIAASNLNNTFPRYLDSEKYEPRETVQTYATAMDISKPNNLKRVFHIYGGKLDAASAEILSPPDISAMRKDLAWKTIDDNGIAEAMRRLYKEHDIIVCPHGGVAEQATELLLGEGKIHKPVVSQMTAHPAKFPDVVEKVLGIELEMPKVLTDLDNIESNYYTITKEQIKSGNGYEIFKGIILEEAKESGIF